MKEKKFIVYYKYGKDLPSGSDVINVNAVDTEDATIKAMESLRQQDRYKGFFLEIVKIQEVESKKCFLCGDSHELTEWEGEGKMKVHLCPKCFKFMEVLKVRKGMPA